MAYPPTRTFTETHVKERCRTIVLKLKSATNDSGKIEAARMVAEVQQRVNTIFDQLLKVHVHDGMEHINQNLLAALRRARDPNAFLELFLMELYDEAIKREKESVKHQMNQAEIQEMDDLSGKASHERRNKDKKVMEAGDYSFYQNFSM